MLLDFLYRKPFYFHDILHVNLQLIELLSIRAPSPEKKLNLLKEIAVENDLDWDPAASETEFFKKHEDLLVSIRL